MISKQWFRIYDCIINYAGTDPVPAVDPMDPPDVPAGGKAHLQDYPYAEQDQGARQ